MRHRLLALAVALPLVFSACGGDDDEPPTPQGDVLTDEQYLDVFCTGITKYQDALMESKTIQGIRDAVDAYVAALSPVRPPADIAAFHAEYLAYLKAAQKGEDPTVLVTTQPPLPPDGPRDRLADKAAKVEACKYPTFLSRSK
jgi:hypothetical protein